MFSDVEIKLKKRNKLLFSRDSHCLEALTDLMQSQNHRTLVMWALDCAAQTLEQFESKYPHEQNLLPKKSIIITIGCFTGKSIRINWNFAGRNF